MTLTDVRLTDARVCSAEGAEREERRAVVVAVHGGASQGDAQAGAPARAEPRGADGGRATAQLRAAGPESGGACFSRGDGAGATWQRRAAVVQLQDGPVGLFAPHSNLQAGDGGDVATSAQNRDFRVPNWWVSVFFADCVSNSAVIHVISICQLSHNIRFRWWEQSEQPQVDGPRPL